MKKALAFIMAALSFLAALAGADIAKVARADTIIVAVQSLPISGIDAMTENSNVACRISYSVQETLFFTDYFDGYKVKPGLAESWKMKDETTLVVKLRRGVKFHNGDEMTADDVAFTFGVEHLLGEKAPGRTVAGPFLGNLEYVKAVDRYTVEIKSKKKDALLEIRFANYPSQIISKKAYSGAESFEAFGRMPVGTGPYKVVEYTEGSRVVLDRFESYWGPAKGAVKRVIFQYVPELSTRIAGLRTGEFDIITELPPDQAGAISSMPNAKVLGGPIANIYGLFFDETNASAMKDPRVRKALTLAIDREKLVRTLFGGYTTVPRNWQMELFGDMYLKDYPGIPYDPKRARELLKEAGYDGSPIVYRSLPGYYTLEQTVAEAITQMWREVGLNIDLRIMENWTQINADTEDRHIINGSNSAYYPDPVGQLWRRYGADSGKDNGVYWTSSAKLVQLGRKLETEKDLKTRREAFRQMLDIFSDDPKGTYLYCLPMLYGVRKGLEWSPIPYEGMDLSVRAIKSSAGK